MASYVKVYNIKNLITLFQLKDGNLAIPEEVEYCIRRYEDDIQRHGYKYFDYKKLLQGVRVSFFPQEIETGKPFRLVMTIR